MLLYKNPKLGVWIHYNHPEAKSWARGLEQTLIGHEQILDHYEQKIVGYQAVPTGEHDEEGNPTFTQGDPIYGDDHECPVYRDGEPIYEYGAEQFELVGWQDEWGTPPTEEELAAFEPPPPVENPVTDVEMRVREMQANRATASLKTDAIKARILQALVDGGMDESQGKGLGIAIIKDHFQALVAFEIGGGGATASQVLYADLAADHRLAPFLSIISDVLGVSGRIK